MTDDLANIDLSWKLTWGGHTWTCADLGPLQWQQLGEILGFDWGSLSPFTSQRHLRAHIVIGYAAVAGRDVDAVAEEFTRARSADILAAIVAGDPAG